MGALGCRKADLHPRVMENMDAIIEFVSELIKKATLMNQKATSISKQVFEGYGKLSQQSIDELRSGARIRVGEKKEDALDFALWKAAKDGEISWDSPWGKAARAGILNAPQW